MINNNWIKCVIVFVMTAQIVFADDSSGSALQQTQDCLRNQTCASALTDLGKAADQNALDVVGGNAASKQELYNIAAEIMPALDQNAGGDPQKMQALIQKAQSDPSNFLNSLPPELQAKIKAAANSVK